MQNCLVTLCSVSDEECGFLCSWWILVEKFSSLHWEVTKKGQEAALGCRLHLMLRSHCWASVLHKQQGLESCVKSGAELWHAWVPVIVQEQRGDREGSMAQASCRMDPSWGTCALCPLKGSKPWEHHYISTKSMSYWFIAEFGYKPGNRLSLIKKTLCLTMSCSLNCPDAGWWPDCGLQGENIFFECAGSEAMDVLIHKGEATLEGSGVSSHLRDVPGTMWAQGLLYNLCGAF